VLTADGVRPLGAHDSAAVRAVLDTDPVANVFVTARLQAAGFDPRRLGVQLWGYSVGGPLESLCYAGPNLIPICATPSAARAFADRAAGQARMCSSIVGPQEAVERLWQRLREVWPPARDVRTGQPLLVTSVNPSVPGDPRVRRVTLPEVDTLLPAAVRMYTEEVGVSPIGHDGGAGYRGRVLELIRMGHSFARIDNGEVVFKAEVGAATRHACQLQGVWVAPRMRGRGIGTAGMATVVAEVLRTVAPVASLYVNAHNTAARRAYERVGFSPTGAFMSVLF